MAVALIVAAGRGERLGADGPKAFVALRGRSLLDWSLAAARAAPSVSAVVVARPPGSPPLAGADSVEGGAARSESVKLALAAAPADEDGLVVVHDAARPLATPALFEEALAAIRAGADAAVAAAPVTDTVKEAGPDHRVRRTLVRAELWAVQTPQAFRRAALAAALDAPPEVLAAATDDAGLVERAGGRVVVCPAPRENIKVTTPLDLRVAELLLQSR